jgi:1-acyl-sn-glycerol-3-phosphate acyltransferase
VTALASAPSNFVRAWRGLYEIVYGCFEAGVRIYFRVLFRQRVVGRPPRLPEGGVLLCPNHQSYLDPAFVQLSVPRRVEFVMAERFYAATGATLFFRLVSAFPLLRGRGARISMRRVAALLRLGHAVAVFPEGRLSLDGSLHPGQRGIAILARRGRVPVVPVAIEGSIRVWPRGARWFRRGDVRLAVGDPMEAPGEESRTTDQAFADSVMAAIARLRAGLPSPRP